MYSNVNRISDMLSNTNICSNSNEKCVVAKVKDVYLTVYCFYIYI